MYIIFVPQLILIISDVWRGVVNWTFTDLVEESASSSKFDIALQKGYLETNSGITKHPFGNIMFSVVVSISNAVVLTFLFWKNEDLFFKESDILGTKPFDKECWDISWIQNEHLGNDQKNELKV